MFGEIEEIHVDGDDSGTSGSGMMMGIVALWLLGVLVTMLMPPVGIILLVLALVVSLGAGVG